MYSPAEEGPEGPPARCEREQLGLVPAGADQRSGQPVVVPDEDEVEGISPTAPIPSGGAAGKLPQGGTERLLVFEVGELLRAQGLPVDLVVVGAEARHGHIELEDAHPTRPVDLDADLLGSELQVAEDEAGRATEGRHEGIDVVSREVLFHLTIRTRSEAETALVGRLPCGGVGRVETREHEHVRHDRLVLDFDPDRLDSLLGEIDAEGATGLVAREHRHGDAEALVFLGLDALLEGNSLHGERTEGRAAEHRSAQCYEHRAKAKPCLSKTQIRRLHPVSSELNSRSPHDLPP